MITDPEPMWGRARRTYVESDARRSSRLPPAPALRERTAALGAALAHGTQPPVWRACADIAAFLASHYGVKPPDVRVLGVRPHRVEDGICTYQLLGDYTPQTGRIRVWMRTAIRTQVTSHKAMLNTLLHEFFHHLDATLWQCPESPHTRGFFLRVDSLYHHALGTPAAERRPLHWVKDGRTWRIDWRRSRVPGTASRPLAHDAADGSKGDGAHAHAHAHAHAQNDNGDHNGDGGAAAAARRTPRKSARERPRPGGDHRPQRRERERDLKGARPRAPRGRRQDRR